MFHFPKRFSDIADFALTEKLAAKEGKIVGKHKTPPMLFLYYMKKRGGGSETRYFSVLRQGTAISLQIGLPRAENFSSYSVMIFP